MKLIATGARSLALVAAAAACGSAVHAQTAGGKWTCQDANVVRATLPYGDRPGHDLLVTDYACTVDGGPMAGSVVSGRNYFDVDGTTWTLVSGNGVIRSAQGAFAAFQNSDGKLTITVTDGKPAGFTMAGKFTLVAAGGAWSAQRGKRLGWTGSASGPGRFVVDTVFE